MIVQSVRPHSAVSMLASSAWSCEKGIKLEPWFMEWLDESADVLREIPPGGHGTSPEAPCQHGAGGGLKFKRQ